MNQKTSSSFLSKKAFVVFFLMLVSFSLLFSSFQVRQATDDMWKMLGITKQDGDDRIKNSFMNGYLYYYGVKNVKNLALNDRGALAKDLLTYTKEYTSTAAFSKEYDNMRKGSKPQEPVLKRVRTVEEIQKEEIAKTEKSIKETEKNIREMPQFAKSWQPLVDLLKKNLRDYQDPKNPYFASIAMGEKNDNDYNIKSYKERTKQWEEAYPETAGQFIASRLQKMLDATKDIDYDAELVEKYGKKRFVNQKYESKNTEWKQGFRAGKEVTEPARAFAQKWLSELQAKKPV